MGIKSAKNAIVRDPQQSARILTAKALGRVGEGRWVIRDEAGGAPIRWENGLAISSLIGESSGYVKPDPARSISQFVYDQAPIHRVEIWRLPQDGEYHVRIFDEIK
jgi:hypothetical protein